MLLGFSLGYVFAGLLRDFCRLMWLLYFLLRPVVLLVLLVLLNMIDLFIFNKAAGFNFTCTKLINS